MFKLGIVTDVKFYKYREARVVGPFLEIPRNTEEGRKFEEKLARKAGNVTRDNHTVYELTKSNGHKLYIGCEDMEFVIGDEVELNRY